jgi:hypothetical protein
MFTDYFKKLTNAITVIPPLAIIALSLMATPLQAQSVLTAQEKSNLEFMGEEEKLARDVYTYLFGVWSTPVFNNISLSEQRHMDAVLASLNFYGVADPAAGNAPGVFTNTTLQQLYDDLVAQGEGSAIAALEVGIVIEETDIADLDTAIAATTRPDLIRLYGNLKKGSLNHLSAFTNNLEALGGDVSGGNQSGNSLSPGTSVYEPISQSLYIPAVNVEVEPGVFKVYDLLLRLLETLPQAFEVVSATETSKLPDSSHASFDVDSGLLTIQDLSVGALNVSIDNTRYTATLQLDNSLGVENLFVVTQVQAK